MLPAPGLVLAFAHGLWHEGERLQQGVKWCLRTDVMYRRVSAEAAEGPVEPAEYELREAAPPPSAEDERADAICLEELKNRLIASGGCAG